MKRDELVRYLDDYLNIKAIQDSSNNGLQVEGADEVSRVALAVDSGLAALDGAAQAGAQMLIVHHGLFWSKPILVTGLHRLRVGRLIESNVSLYAAHLPLDYHGEVGNNAVLCRLLGVDDVAPFGEYGSLHAGLAGRLPAALSLGEFMTRVEQVVQDQVVQVWPFGPQAVQRVAVISGGAAFLLGQAAAAGVDVYLTGEVSHGYYHDAQELELNVVFGGHYATETVGLRALADHLADRFGLQTVFLDLPTGA